MSAETIDTPVRLTERAAKRIAAILTEEPAAVMLRLAVTGGGCAGFRYDFCFDDARAEGDLVIEGKGATVLDRTARPAASHAAALTPLKVLQNRFCRGQAPQGWLIADQDANGATFTLASPDRTMTAAFGIVGIGSGQAAGFYGPQFANPS